MVQEVIVDAEDDLEGTENKEEPDEMPVMVEDSEDEEDTEEESDDGERGSEVKQGTEREGNGRNGKKNFPAKVKAAVLDYFKGNRCVCVFCALTADPFNFFFFLQTMPTKKPRAGGLRSTSREKYTLINCAAGWMTKRTSARKPRRSAWCENKEKQTWGRGNTRRWSRRWHRRFAIFVR